MADGWTNNWFTGSPLTDEHGYRAQPQVTPNWEQWQSGNGPFVPQAQLPMDAWGRTLGGPVTAMPGQGRFSPRTPNGTYSSPGQMMGNPIDGGESYGVLAQGQGWTTPVRSAPQQRVGNGASGAWSGSLPNVNGASGSWGPMPADAVAAIPARGQPGHFRVRTPAPTQAARRAAAVPPPSQLPVPTGQANMYGGSIDYGHNLTNGGQMPRTPVTTATGVQTGPGGIAAAGYGPSPMQALHSNVQAQTAAQVAAPGATVASPAAAAAGGPPSGYVSPTVWDKAGVQQQQLQEPASMWSWGNPDAYKTVFSGLETLGGLGLSGYALYQADKQFELQEDYAKRNFNNQVSTYNTNVENRARGRNATDSRASEDARIANERLAKK